MDTAADLSLPGGETRRGFLKKSAGLILAVHGGLFAPMTDAEALKPAVSPWYRRTLRWGQTNITETDPAHYDVKWWREHWKRTHTQGVIVNAGGIVAYYPSRFPLHHRALALGDRDLYGELAGAAHEEGLVVLARMDSNRAHDEFYRAHPDWFAVDAGGKPYRAGDLYVSCINSPYYDEYLPSILQEIIERSKPDGICDNSWSGLGRNSICHCQFCQKRFRERTGAAIPGVKNWDDPVYREWIRWNYDRRLEVWDFNNRITRDAGGTGCLWIGMISGSITGQSGSFRDLKDICRRAEIILLDHQSRDNVAGFQQNGETGKLIHGLLGWDKLIPESMAMYQAGRPTFRLSSKPEPEARLWMLDGFAGGVQPWWHHVGAYPEDRRMYRTADPVLRWHEANQLYLVNREPIATVGVVWSQTNTDFYGRDNAEELVDLPWRGVTTALIKARIPYLPIHIDHLAQTEGSFSVLVMPNLGAVTDAQAASIRRFVGRGGGLVATGETSRCYQWGGPRFDFGLADLFGAHVIGEIPASLDANKRQSVAETAHTYLRLTPGWQASHVGRRNAGAQPASRERHAILRGFEETDILPFGGRLELLRLDPGATVLATYIPPFPVYPPETAWMREPRTEIPGLILNQRSPSGRVAFIPADIDRRFARDNLPDHARLLANVVRWAAGDRIPLVVEGPGFIDCHLYRQQGRVILHLVNLTGAGTWRAPVDELIPVGPLDVRILLPEGIRGKKLLMLVARGNVAGTVRDGWIQFRLESVLDHEVVVIT